ncbi:MAG: hypothetical protein JKY65_01320 [Planctomycetes bacterium]|nr:hypothetical protein [Planctomycetota bacterium]
MKRHALILAATLLATGCVGNYNGLPTERGPRNIKARTRPDLAKKVQWRKIMVGAGKTQSLLGYVRTDSGAHAGGAATYWIYNKAFVMVGRVSPRGSVVTIDPAGQEKWTGNYSLPLACLHLFGYQTRKTILFESMPAPRG